MELTFSRSHIQEQIHVLWVLKLIWFLRPSLTKRIKNLAQKWIFI